MQNHAHHTPHLTTALTGPLQLLEKKLLDRQDDIENWFLEQWHVSPAPVYGSVDLRNAGFKLAPVDMNLFPAGFNNLNAEFLPLAIDAAKETLLKIMPNAKKILLLPESHTRNLFYWENINDLLKMVTGANLEVQVGTLLPDYPQGSVMPLKNGGTVSVETIVRHGNKISLQNFVPDIILLNNDLSEGIPDILKNLDQPIVPPAELGWSQRLKSGHFQYYDEVSREFAKLIDIDPWLVAPFFKHCGEVNFMNGEGVECLRSSVQELFTLINKKYVEYKIACKPFIIIKADAGTYGMAVMTVRNVEELDNLNRKQRTAMSKTKGGQLVQKVIIQEGIYTFETWGEDNAVAEPVVYLIGERVIGGFYRVHKERGVDENLNSPGMHFEPLAFARDCHKPGKECAPHEQENRFYAYGVVARLSMLAAAREMLNS